MFTFYDNYTSNYEFASRLKTTLLRITAACCGTAIGIATACAILGVALRFSDQSLV